MVANYTLVSDMIGIGHPDRHVGNGPLIRTYSSQPSSAFGLQNNDSFCVLLEEIYLSTHMPRRPTMPPQQTWGETRSCRIPLLAG